LANEEALSIFLSDGKIEIDNNAAERAMRLVGRIGFLLALIKGEMLLQIFIQLSHLRVHRMLTLSPNAFAHLK